MQFTSLFVVLSAIAATAIAAPTADSNGARLARGLSPLAPRKLYNPSAVSAAKRASPSGTSPQCNAPAGQCCLPDGHGGFFPGIWIECVGDGNKVTIL